MENVTIIQVVELTTFAFHTIPSMTGTAMAISTQHTCTEPSMKFLSTMETLSKKVFIITTRLVLSALSNHVVPLLMMPARNDCPSGWTEEYHGYLMTNYYNHPNQKDFICIDKDPEYIHGSHARRGENWLYPVEGYCGSLPCLPYVQHRELTCAVCTK